MKYWVWEKSWLVRTCHVYLMTQNIYKHRSCQLPSKNGEMNKRIVWWLKDILMIISDILVKNNHWLLRNEMINLHWISCVFAMAKKIAPTLYKNIYLRKLYQRIRQLKCRVREWTEWVKIVQRWRKRVHFALRMGEGCLLFQSLLHSVWAVAQIEWLLLPPRLGCGPNRVAFNSVRLVVCLDRYFVFLAQSIIGCYLR